ncbi:MAG: glycosyltransferase [Clostridiales bacterium]|nr:glycosyltransferase [Clostridiales bacterium]
MIPQQCCVLIPSLSPDERLPAYVKELQAAEFGLILVVDDGSKEEYQPIFDEIAGWERCHVLHHEVNYGKGQALRTGFAYLKEYTDLKGVITADSDGQHIVSDTVMLAKELGEEKELLLGSRDFSKNSVQVPPKSRVGNRITSVVFRLFYGQYLPDTQTGLRAFNRELMDFMLNVSGNRFEYEMNMLIQCAMQKIPMRVLPINTIYHDDNAGTHFHPIRDSWRIYKLLLGNFFRYSAASILSFLLDTGIVALLMYWLFKDQPDIRFLGIDFAAKALLAAPIARLISAPVNFLLNRNFVFQVKESKGAAQRYIVLAACSLVITTLLYGYLDHFVKAAWLHIPLYVVIQIAMYFVNYRFQQGWVFREKK